MSLENPVPFRFIGLDIHKYYLIATAVDADLNQVFGPQRVQLEHLQAWIHKCLSPQDAIVLEMTTNTWQVYDELLPFVHSITVVHPPHVALITRAQVMTDKIAALTLAKLLAKGLLAGIWVPPEDVRQRRILIAQRSKMTRLSTQAKNRLHAVLHRHHLLPPPGDLFSPDLRVWWLNLPIHPIERVRTLSDLDTLAFARQQILILDQAISSLAAADDRLPLLLQLPGVSLLTALTILAAIGDISRFPDAKHLVGYAGLGARIHDSGLSSRSGRITKSGRKDLRSSLVEAAHTAANTHPHWQAELSRLEPRLGHNKAIVAIARKLLVAVWHILAHSSADKHADPERIARKFFQAAYAFGKFSRPKDQSSAAYVRLQLDRLHIGQNLSIIHWGSVKHPIRLPPSSLLLPDS
jgi:transposase